MFEILKLRTTLGNPAIRDPRKASPAAGYVGLPWHTAKALKPGEAVCPTGAFQAAKNATTGIDLGRCTFCGDCLRACPSGSISFGPSHRLGASSREALILRPEETEAEYLERAIVARRELKRLFGRSLKLRQVSAGGCGACELEMNAINNVNFDAGRYGIEWVASPRHADVIVVTGPITANMADALEDTWAAAPEPKLLVLAGACAISGGIFAGSDELNRSFLKHVKPDLYVPGCPPHPLTLIDALLALLGKR